MMHTIFEGLLPAWDSEGYAKAYNVPSRATLEPEQYQIWPEVHFLRDSVLEALVDSFLTAARLIPNCNIHTQAVLQAREPGHDTASCEALNAAFSALCSWHRSASWSKLKLN